MRVLFYYTNYVYVNEIRYKRLPTQCYFVRAHVDIIIFIELIKGSHIIDSQL